jgi:hypothetical protein
MLSQRAAEIGLLLRNRHISDVHSVAAGVAGLEYYIKLAMPSLRLTVSEFAPVNVGRLRKVFHECDRIELFDIRTGDWGTIQPVHSPNTLVLMYRTDPYLSNTQWRAAFARMAARGVRQVLFIPDTLISVEYILLLQARWWKARLTREPLTFTGYVRTDKTFRSLWQGIYACEPLSICHKRGYWLTATGRAPLRS